MDQQFIDGIREDVTQALTKENRDRNDPESLRVALRELLDHAIDSPQLAPLLRIDYEVTKRSPDEAELTVVVLFQADDEVHKATCKRAISWAYLPSAVRHKFISENVPVQAFMLFTREDSVDKQET